MRVVWGKAEHGVFLLSNPMHSDFFWFFLFAVLSVLSGTHILVVRAGGLLLILCLKFLLDGFLIIKQTTSTALWEKSPRCGRHGYL